MTKPRAMLAGDDPDADPTISCLAAIRAPPREAETAPRTADGERLLCKKFCRRGADGAAACARPDCPDAHVPIAERQACWTFERYGVCKFEEARERDPAAPQCWFPHPTPPPATHHLALQVEVGMSDRVVSRCRELLGDDAVVGAARADLSRNGDVVILVDGGAGGVAGAATALGADKHLLSKLKRIYATGGGPGLVADASVCGDSADALDDALRATLASLVDAGVSGGDAKVRARCFPPRTQKVILDALHSALDSQTNARGGGWETCARMDDATHVLDVVAVRGRAHVTVWRTDPRLHGVDLRKLLIRSCEDARKERDGSGAMCRAFHKIEEATRRAGVVVDPAWRCVDVGAAPGGWTQWLCDNGLDEKKGGRVYAVDPAELGDFKRGLPPNVTHLKMRGEDAVGVVQRDGPIDLLVCDANVSPEAAAGILAGFIPALRTGSTLVLTFKGATKGFAEWRRQMEDAVVMLTRKGFETPSVYHLFSNCSREKTLVAKFAGGLSDSSGKKKDNLTKKGDPIDPQKAMKDADRARLLLARSLAVFATMPGEFAEAHIKARGFNPPPNGSVRLVRGRLLKILSDEVLSESSWHQA